MTGHSGELARDDPETRKAAFWTAITAHDLRQDLPPEVAEILALGDDFWWITPGEHEAMVTRARRCSAADDSMSWEARDAYYGAGERGLLEPGKTYHDFRERELVLVYSEFYGGHQFSYDGTTGHRFSPRGDVSHITARTGGDMLALGAIAERFLNQES